ncbi:MAG: hypothetical protein ACXU89_17820 [Xanthobacteraceae bacterium]
MPNERNAKLWQNRGEDHETISCVAAGCLLRAADCGCTSGQRRRRFRHSRRRAYFNRQKLDRVGDYLRNEIAQGKIPGAIVLIRQHARGTPEDSADGEKADL